MGIDPNAYLKHFRDYGCKFFRIGENYVSRFSKEDAHWLKRYGLPENAIPFFFFDFFIQELREIEIPDCKFILGTAFEPASHHYLYVSNNEEVMLYMSDGSHFFVNSSVKHLIGCLYHYSTWLEEQEECFILDHDHMVKEEEMFDLYCRLRDSDRLAMSSNGIWGRLVQTDVNFVVHASYSGSSN